MVICESCQAQPKIDFEKMKWGSFTKQFKAFKKENPDSDIDDLGDFADFVISNPDKFRKTTLKRANFYKNVIEKKGGDFFGNIKRAFTSTWNKQPQGAEKKALNFVLNTAEPALLKPIQILAPPVGQLGEAQRKLLASHYGMEGGYKRFL